MDYVYLAVKFVVGGAIVAGVSMLAHYVDPKYGGILAAAPITTTLAFIFTRAETSPDTTRELAVASFYFSIPSVIFLISVYFLMSRFSFAPSLIIAYFIWLSAVLAVNRLISVS